MATTEQIPDILRGNIELLERKCGPQHHYSDVIDPKDPDALHTIREGSKPYDSIELTSLDEIDPSFQTFLFDHLKGGADKKIDRLTARYGTEPSFVRRLIGDRKKATVLVFNEAPRDDKNIKDGANGPPFYVALTGNDVEVVSTLTTLPNTLSLLAEFNGVRALFKVIEKDHPLLDVGEQFRSQYAGAFRNHPEMLKPVYQYSSIEELIASKERGEHCEDLIATDSREGNVVYEDTFHNLLIRQKDGTTFRSLDVGDAAVLEVTHGKKQLEVPVHIGTDLRSAPVGQFVVYQNVDRRNGRQHAAAALLEVIVRVDDDHPKRSKKTAGHALRKELGGDAIDLSQAIVVLRKDSPKAY